ncbi:MAG: hypothetical protein JW866_07965 [Ignavibacteriales bacterium]|nr:hypothetical protein [Ignavibacteriales bacterium]
MKQNTILLILLIVFSLTSCLHYEQVTTLKIDGSGKMYIHYWTSWKSDKDSVIFKELGMFNSDSLSKEFEASFTEINFVEVYKDDNDSTFHAKIQFSFEHFDSLKSINALSYCEFSFRDGSENTKIFSQFIPSFATGFGIGKQKFSISYTYYIPGDILEHNAMERDNNKLVWQYSHDEIGRGKYIYATFKPFKLKETPVWIYIIASMILLVVVVYLFKKK